MLNSDSPTEGVGVMVADEARVRRRDSGSRFPSTAIPSAQYEEPQSLAEHSAFQPETGVPVILQLARTSPCALK